MNIVYLFMINENISIELNTLLFSGFVTVCCYQIDLQFIYK